MKIELKPCPFCGGKPTVVDYRLDGYAIACTQFYSCDVTPKTDKFSTIEMATDAWNRRAGEPDEE